MSAGTDREGTGTPTGASGGAASAEPPRPFPARIARWGFFAVALVLGTALLVSSITSYVGARTLLDTVIRGQAEGLHHALRRHLEETRHHGPPRDEELAAFIEEHADEGIRYVALMGADGVPLAAAGTSTDPRPLRPGELRVIGEHVQISFALGPPGDGPPGKGPPGKGLPGKGLGKGLPGKGLGKGLPGKGLGPLDALGPHRPPPMMMELRPEAALALLARARRDLGVGVTVAVALMLAAAVFWRLSRRAQAAEARLGQQRHLAALGEMSAVLAHEIRNPLASLKGHAQLLAERVGDDPALARKVGRIVDEAQRLEALTHGLLEFARTGRLQLAETDPAALLRRCADACAQGPSPAPTVDVQAQGAPARWSLDAPKLERVIGNLLDNAAQAAPATAVEARVYGDAGRLVFEVRDHGPGVPPEDRARIFEPFHTTRTRGTGLGLAVAQRIVEQHGGTLVALDAPGGGACFRITLPPAAPPTTA